MILSILDFSADSYAWYIEMYIGLFLIIPFLNILWNNLNDVGRKWLIITLLGLTALPSLLNCWDLLSLGDKTRVYSAIVPDYWETLYPITYYFLGAYLKEETKKFFLLKESIILLGLMIVFGLFNYYRSYDGTYEWIGYNNICFDFPSTNSSPYGKNSQYSEERDFEDIRIVSGNLPCISHIR